MSKYNQRCFEKTLERFRYCIFERHIYLFQKLKRIQKTCQDNITIFKLKENFD